MFFVGLVQMTSSPDLQLNRHQVEEGVHEASARGAALVALPEGFLGLGCDTLKTELAETIPGAVTSWLGGLAQKSGVYLLAGGMPERSPDGSRVFMTSVLIDPRGNLLGLYRKIHLFDATLPDGTSLRESEKTQPGEHVVVLSTPLATMGMSICYDLRFPELYRRLSAAGAEVLWVPSAFTAQTGRDHWHVLLRARAIENLCFVAAPAQVGEHGGGRESFGHSLVVDPWGRTIAEGGTKPEVVVAPIDLEALHVRRHQLPCLSHRRLG